MACTNKSYLVPTLFYRRYGDIFVVADLGSYVTYKSYVPLHYTVVYYVLHHACACMNSILSLSAVSSMPVTVLSIMKLPTQCVLFAVDPKYHGENMAMTIMKLTCRYIVHV